MATELEKLKKVVLGFEGTKRNAYIPMQRGVVIGNSGVTIGKGLDLGQQNASSINALKEYGLSEDLAKKLREHPDLGKTFKGKTVEDAAFTPMSLTAEEEEQLNTSLVKKYKQSFETAYEANVGRSASQDLTENQRVALASAYFNLGNGLFKKKDKNPNSPTYNQLVPTNFTNQLKENKLEDAAKNLANWTSGATKYRRGAEAALFSNQIGTDAATTKRDELRRMQPNNLTSYVDNLKIVPVVSEDRLTPQQMEQATEPVNINTEPTGLENPFLAVRNWWNSL